MNILMLHPHDIYSQSEPWTVRITYLATELVKRSHRVRLVYHLLDPSVGLAEASKRQEFPFDTIPSYRWQFALFAKMRYISELGQWADIIHFQKCFPHVSVPSIYASYKQDKPVHYDWDDWEYGIYNYAPMNRIVGKSIDIFEKVLPKIVDTVSVASDELWKKCRALGVPDHRIFEAHVGADIEKFHPRVDGSEIKKWHNIEGPIVLYLGQLHGAQYAELFLHAAKMLLERGVNTTFMVVGTGERFGELFHLAESLRIAHKIVFTGAVDHNLIPKYIAAADVAVACFEDTEQTRCKSPLKVVEYLATGKAIVASRMGEVTKMLDGGKCGILVEPGNAEQLADGIQKILSDPNLKRDLGIRARRRAEEKYNWGVTANNLLTAYEFALEEYKWLYWKQPKAYVPGAPETFKQTSEQSSAPAATQAPPPNASPAPQALSPFSAKSTSTASACSEPSGTSSTTREKNILQTNQDENISRPKTKNPEEAERHVDSAPGEQARLPISKIGSTACAQPAIKQQPTSKTKKKPQINFRLPPKVRPVDQLVSPKNIPTIPIGETVPLKPTSALSSFVYYNLDLIGVMDGSESYIGPYTLQIDPTNRCNNDCIACWCRSPLLLDKRIPAKIESQALPFELVRDLIDDAVDMGTKEIYIAGGGEPFMHPDIMKIIEYIKKKGLICNLNTNFTLINKDIAYRLAELGVNYMTISIWAGTAKTYADLHPNKTEETFCQIEEVLSYMNSIKREIPYVKVYQVISNLNYFDIYEMVEFTRRTGSESVEFTILDTIPDRTDSLLLNEEQRKWLFEQCQYIWDEYQKEKNPNKLLLFKFDQFMRRISGEHTLTGEHDKNIIDKLPCTVGWIFSRALADGNVNYCLKAHRIPIGNLYEHSFRELWCSARQKEFRRMTNAYKKRGPFFALIGNDPGAKIGCYKSCDDLGRIGHMHDRMQALKPRQKLILKGSQIYFRLTGKHLKPQQWPKNVDGFDRESLYKKFSGEC